MFKNIVVQSFKRCAKLSTGKKKKFQNIFKNIISPSSSDNEWFRRTRRSRPSQVAIFDDSKYVPTNQSAKYESVHLQKNCIVQFDKRPLK